jgi:16S rRNA (cytidine1402-2'-O)-methyltransferase
MLYLVASPIGNLADITYRAVAVLQNCDYILCEDTRHSQTLLTHYAIHKPLKSYHQFNEASREDDLIADLKQGLEIALISDAGTPGICDPGERLVKRCIQEAIPFTALPGPCAAILALTLSGQDTAQFQFVGFLPKKDSEFKTRLQEILRYPGTTICYESPHRIQETIQEIALVAKTRRLTIARELTKKFEERLIGTAEELALRLQEHPLKGEIVLLIEGEKEPEIDFERLTPAEHVKIMQETYGLSLKDAIKAVAAQRKLPKREVYSQVHIEE